MKIQFTIRESLNDIIDQLSNSDFWSVKIQNDSGKKVIKIKDLAYDLEATAEIFSKEIIIHTAWSNFTYRIFQVDKKVFCEYQGAFRGLLEQKLLPHMTPVGNILDCEVLESSLYKSGERKTLREYARDNVRQRRLREQSQTSSEENGNSFNKGDYPSFMKEDMPCE